MLNRQQEKEQARFRREQARNEEAVALRARQDATTEEEIMSSHHSSGNAVAIAVQTSASLNHSVSLLSATAGLSTTLPVPVHAELSMKASASSNGLNLPPLLPEALVLPTAQESVPPLQPPNLLLNLQHEYFSAEDSARMLAGQPDLQLGAVVLHGPNIDGIYTTVASVLAAAETVLGSTIKNELDLKEQLLVHLKPEMAVAPYGHTPEGRLLNAEVEKVFTEDNITRMSAEFSAEERNTNRLRAGIGRLHGVLSTLRNVQRVDGIPGSTDRSAEVFAYFYTSDISEGASLASANLAVQIVDDDTQETLKKFTSFGATGTNMSTSSHADAPRDDYAKELFAGALASFPVGASDEVQEEASVAARNAFTIYEFSLGGKVVATTNVKRLFKLVISGAGLGMEPLMVKVGPNTYLPVRIKHQAMGTVPLVLRTCTQSAQKVPRESLVHYLADKRTEFAAYQVFY